MHTEGIEPLELAVKGSYVLFMDMPLAVTVTVGKLGDISFQPGYYAYTGSALNGLKNRLRRHLRTEKKLHWHIDYLLQQASITGIMVVESDQRLECVIAGSIGDAFEVIPDFGSSDCTCPGHLFYSKKKMLDRVAELVQIEGLNPRLLNREMKEKKND